jgi:hypothetical protein
MIRFHVEVKYLLLKTYNWLKHPLLLARATRGDLDWQKQPISRLQAGNGPVKRLCRRTYLSAFYQP